MCGRYTLAQIERLQRRYGYGANEAELRPRYNIAPTTAVAVILDEEPAALTTVRWGLIPAWSKDRKIAASLINARAETVAEKPSFRTAFKKRRCLILADGFYEWQRRDAGKVPHYMQLAGAEPFAFAGLWDEWHDPEAGGAALRTCAIITTEPNELMASIHNRMPVILPPEQERRWLAPDAELTELQSLLLPYPADAMTAHTVSSRVNSVQNQEPALVEPVAAGDAPSAVPAPPWFF
jgi:putative SOS response-associated peptidase YedK